MRGRRFAPAAAASLLVSTSFPRGTFSFFVAPPPGVSTSSVFRRRTTPAASSPVYIPDVRYDPSREPDVVSGAIFVDPFSAYHGGHLVSAAIRQYGAGAVRVFSPYSARGVGGALARNAAAAGESGAPPPEDLLSRTAPLDRAELESWLRAIPFPVVAVLCETDSGLEYAEELSCAIAACPSGGALRHNGRCGARRDKYLMNGVCRDAGIATVRQAMCHSEEEAVRTALEFGMGGEGVEGIIVKPLRGVASNRVSLCRTEFSVRYATQCILGTTVFGTFDERYDAVLLQDFLPGKEYAVDTVSKNGQHKTAAIWNYEKISTTTTIDDADDGAPQNQPFVYSCSRLVSGDDPRHPAEKIVSYVESVLDALGVKWGMAHTEVKVAPDGTIRLIEVNVRQHNANFAPMCQACVGYNALDLCLSAYLHDDDGDMEDEFGMAPRVPILRFAGNEVSLICFVEGTVTAVNHLEEIEDMESVVGMEVYPNFEIGCGVQKTVDIRTDAGFIHLIHEDEEVLDRDYQRICVLMQTMFEV